jgi:NitT/TauT family transport system ATP-binding protein
VLLMSPRPGRIGREFRIPLPRPRDINSPALAELAAQTASALKEAGTVSS